MTDALPHQIYRQAVEAHDHGRLSDLFTPGMKFHSPTKLKPFEGAEMARWLMGHILEVIEDFTFTDVWGDRQRAALFFRGVIGGKSCEGVDHLTFDADGRITDFRVMIRPLTALSSLNEIMGQRLAAKANPTQDSTPA